MNSEAICLILKDYPKFENYLEDVQFSNLNRLESSILSFYNGGDMASIKRNMWSDRILSDVEKLIISELEKALSKINSVEPDKIISRYEINLSDSERKNLVEKLKKCFTNSINFSNKSFWNFSEDDWKNEEDYQIIVTTSSNSKAKRVYPLYGESRLSEKEVIFSPNSEFKVISADDHHATLIEL